MHNVSLYDTGCDSGYSYDRKRGEGLVVASVIGGIISFVAGIIMTLVGLFDPIAASGGLALAGAIIAALPLLHTVMYITHRNFGLNAKATEAMDAIYTLPKKERKNYKISRDDVKIMTKSEASELVSEIAAYRRHRTHNTGLGRLSSSLKEYNKTVKDIEGI